MAGCHFINILKLDEEGERVENFSCPNGTLEILSPNLAFRATGNEPFWAIEVEIDNKLKFTSLTENFPEFTLPYNPPERPGDMSLLVYRAKTSTVKAEVIIKREICTDTMKGNESPYTVTISLQQLAGGDSTVFKGCGTYLDNHRINDIWLLKKINGKPVEIPESRPYPSLEVDLANKTFFGYGGCNKFHGSLELNGNTIETGSVASTRMACADTGNLERIYLLAISNKQLDFTISDDSTMIIADGKTDLLFRRAP